jgi:hypothetical protein
VSGFVSGLFDPNFEVKYALVSDDDPATGMQDLLRLPQRFFACDVRMLAKDVHQASGDRAFFYV